MSNRLYFTTEQASEREPIEELSGVRLLQAIDCEDGRLPDGAEGTVVAVYGDGEAYCVEFEKPFHALATVSAEQIEAIIGESREDLVSSLGTSDR